MFSNSRICIATSVILIALMWFGVLSWKNDQQEKTLDVQPTQNLIETSAQKSITTPQQPKIRTKGIEEFVIGKRVLGKNPLVTEEERALFGPEPTPETHQGYVLLLPHEENDSVTLAQLLRPKDWLNEDFARIVELESEPDENGMTTQEEVIFVWLELPEMGTVGWAELLGVVEFDQFTSSKGNLVTGTFCHLAPETIDLVIEDVDPIGCTPNHPFWSVDRQDYISAGELVPNERVLLYNGDTKRVINKLSRPGPEFVYNLEVFGEHVYHVTTDGVLVHNNCTTHLHHSLPKFLGGFIKQDLIRLDAKVHQEFHALLSKNLKKNGLFAGNTKKDDWSRLFQTYSDTRGQAFDILFDTSREIDAKYKTNITHSLWKNILNRNYE
jgi:hypothetical protein